MKVTLASPFRAFSGTYAKSDLVFFSRNGVSFARGRVEPNNPRTDDQVKIRSYFTLATRQWQQLTDAQRTDWENYAKLHFSPEDGNGITPNGIAVYLKANSIRQVLGLSMVSAAPTVAPPSPLTSIVQLGAQNPDSIGLELHHGLTDLTDLQVIVRMTPAMPTVARTPELSDYRFVRGVSPNSATALVASGQIVSFAPTQFILDDGERYGVEARIVRTTDGLQSRPVYGDFRKSI